MANKTYDERSVLIEQCLKDAYCERTGEIIEEGFTDWLAGKKAKLGARMSNIATGAKNIAGRVANGASNAVGAVKHANKSRKLNKYANQLSDIGSALGKDNYSKDAEALRAQAGQKFQGQKFQGQEYQDANAAEQQAVLNSLSGKIQKLIQEFESKGGSVEELFANMGMGAAENEEFNESYKIHKNSKSQKLMLENIQ